MGSWSRRVSLGRLLLALLFTAFAFVLASWTTARADDGGPLAHVTEAVPSVGQVVGEATETVVSTSAAVPLVETEPVVKPVVDVVEKTVAKPVAAVDRATEAVVEETSEAVSDTTVRVIDTVKEIAPVSAAVVDPVVQVVVPAVLDEDPAPLPDLPVVDAVDVVDVIDIVDVVEPEATGSTSSAPPVVAHEPDTAGSTSPVASVLPMPAAPAVVFEEPSAAVDPEVTPDRAVMQTSVARAAGSPAERLPGGSPNRPPAVVAGSAPVPGGASSSGAPDAGLTPSIFALPRFAPSVVDGAQSCPAPGPCADPGSRPG